MNCHTIKGGMVMKRKMKAVAALSLAAVMLLVFARYIQQGEVHRMEEAPQQQTQQQTQLSSRQVQKLQHPIQERR